MRCSVKAAPFHMYKEFYMKIFVSVSSKQMSLAEFNVKLRKAAETIVGSNSSYVVAEPSDDYDSDKLIYIQSDDTLDFSPSTATLVKILDELKKEIKEIKLEGKHSSVGKSSNYGYLSIKVPNLKI